MSYTEIRKRHEIVIEFIDEKKGIEYYRNADGKLVSQPDIAVQKSHRKYRMH